jgi:hypothetical protein
VLDLISNINIHDVVLENTATLPGEKPSEDIGLSDTMFQNRNYPCFICYMGTANKSDIIIA